MVAASISGCTRLLLTATSTIKRNKNAYHHVALFLLLFFAYMDLGRIP